MYISIFLLFKEMNVSETVIDLTQSFLKPIDNNVTDATNTIYEHLGPIHYGLPRSQELVEDGLSDRYRVTCIQMKILLV